jgi:uncharacterized iron-regulated membrane protein
MIGKPGLFRVHKWLGITAAAFLFVQALTGIALVFGPELARLIDPSGMTSKPGAADAPPSFLIAAAEARYPHYRISRLVYPATADGTYLVHLTDEHGSIRYISLDRHDASVLREGSIWHFPMIAVFNIHDQWLAGRPGMALVMMSGVSLVIMAISGFAFWWPRRSVRKSLAVRWDSKPRLVLRQLHRTTGVLAFPLLLFQAATGLTIVIPMVTDQPARQWNMRESFAPRVDLAVALARPLYPGHAIRDVRIVSPDRINVFFKAPERNSRAVHRVTVDAPGRRVEAVLDASADRAIWVVTYPLHTGEFLGLAGRIVLLFLGFALAGQAGAGALMWVQARRAKAHSARERTSKRSGSAPKAAHDPAL